MSTVSPEQLFADYRGDVPGASLLLQRDGVTKLAIAFGLADVEQHIQATSATNYRLASVSKQFTAMAAMLLVADNKLALDDSLAHFFANSPTFWQQISLRHLLTHTSGLLDYENLIPANATEQVHDQDIIDLVRTQPNGYFAPGTTYRYSNTAYCLLALIIAQVAEQPFSTFLRERIFAPLGMHNTLAHEEGTSIVRHRAYGHSLRNGVWQRTDQSITSATLGDGGIYSSVLDLARWDAALFNGKLLPAALMRQVFTPYAITSDGTGYGLGWFLRGSTIAYHTGDSIGFRTAILRHLDRRLTAIVLVNRSDAAPFALAEALMQGM